MNAPPPRLVLVIPCYKESERLPRLLPALVTALQDLPCLIQVVDDGSPAPELEGTRVLVQELHSRFPATLAPLLALPQNQGKGGAVRSGWRAHSETELWALIDADGSISPEEARRVILLALAQPNTAYFASRIKMMGRQVHRSGLRHYYGRIFATVSSTLLRVEIYDSQCGFKIIPGSALRPRVDQLQENGFAFDLEILMTLLDQNVPIEEVPIDWTHVSGSKVNLIRDSLAMLASVLRIRKAFPPR